MISADIRDRETDPPRGRPAPVASITSREWVGARQTRTSSLDPPTIVGYQSRAGTARDGGNRRLRRNSPPVILSRSHLLAPTTGDSLKTASAVGWSPDRGRGLGESDVVRHRDPDKRDILMRIELRPSPTRSRRPGRSSLQMSIDTPVDTTIAERASLCSGRGARRDPRAVLGRTCTRSQSA